MFKIGFILLSVIIFIPEMKAQQYDVQYYLGQARQNSPLLKDFQNQIRSNQIDSLRIHAGFGPMINVVSDNLYAPVINGWGYDEAITNGANISARVTVSKEIVGKRNRLNQYQVIGIQNQTLQNAFKVTEQDLVRKVTGQYITTYGFWQQYEYEQEVLNLLKREESIFKNLTEKNIYKQADYLAFLVTLQQQEIQHAQTKNQYQNNLATLNYWCGIEDTTTISLVVPVLNVSTLPDIQNSVFFQSFITDSLKLSVEDKQIDFSYKPKVNLYGDAGYNSSWIYEPWKNFGVSAGINLRLILYDGKQRQMQHDKNFITGQTRQNYRSFFMKQYHQQINQLMQQLNLNQKLSGLLIQQSEYAKTLVEANHKLVETGDARVTDYILAINNYLAVKNTIMQNTIERYNLINEINYWNRSK